MEFRDTVIRLQPVKPWTEWSAAFADLGTFLPLVLGLVVVAGMDPVGLLYGFGVFALGTALVYRRPIPVQPMKAVAAMGIAGLISADTLVATGILMGMLLLVLSRTGQIERLKQWIPKTVLHGMRAALALTLIASTVRLVDADASGVVCLLALLVVLQYTPLKSISAPVVLVVGFLLFSQGVVQWPALEWAWTWPAFSVPPWEAFQHAAVDALLPQLALTLTNALILTAVIAKDYFPDDADRLTETRLAFTSGLANLCLSPFGAMPMCHGAGGLVAHHALGSRTGASILVFGVVCIGLAGVFGPQALQVLLAIPGEAVLTLLVYAAWVLADPQRLLRIRPGCQGVVLMMLPVAWFGGLFLALLVGLVAEKLRVQWSRPVADG